MVKRPVDMKSMKVIECFCFSSPITWNMKVVPGCVQCYAQLKPPVFSEGPGRGGAMKYSVELHQYVDDTTAVTVILRSLGA